MSLIAIVAITNHRDWILSKERPSSTLAAEGIIEVQIGVVAIWIAQAIQWIDLLIATLSAELVTLIEIIQVAGLNE